jgi:hypothetical protein
MLLKAEVTGRFDHDGDANKLLYAPSTEGLRFRESRRYTVEYTGSSASLGAFLQRVLADSTSHSLTVGDSPALTGFAFHLDYGMKPGALDLEKETIMQYFHGLENPDFQIQSLKIQRRIYVFGASPESAATEAEKFVRDIVNPAIHHHQVQLAS